MTNSKSLWDFHRQQTSSRNCHSVAGAFSVMASPNESADPSTGQPSPQKAEDIIYYRGTRPTKKRLPTKQIVIDRRFSTWVRQKDAGVDPEGIEPSSKRGNHTLSTRLSLPSFSSNAECRATLTPPYPLNFRRACEAKRNYSRFVCTTMPASFGKRASEWCLVRSRRERIKLWCTILRSSSESIIVFAS